MSQSRSISQEQATERLELSTLGLLCAMHTLSTSERELLLKYLESADEFALHSQRIASITGMNSEQIRLALNRLADPRWARGWKKLSTSLKSKLKFWMQ